jgi:hypothetical protein
VSSLVDKSMVVADRGPVGMRYRLLETLRQYGEDQLELRGETALLRDRHAMYYADLIAELDLLVRGARQIEGEAQISIEWDNLRAAHLWSLAQDDLDRAERLAEGSFLHATFRVRHEHAAMLQRTVQLGDERGRPSTTMLGMLSYWMDLQGSDEESRRLARRGIEVAPSPDHPATVNCWWKFTGASAANVPGSPETLAAVQHHVAAVANIPDLDVDWFALVGLVDGSAQCDPASAPALRQQLGDIAARVQCPALTMFTCQFEANACLDASPPDSVRPSPPFDISPRSPAPSVTCNPGPWPCAALPWDPPASTLPTHSTAATTRSTPCPRSTTGRRHGRRWSPPRSPCRGPGAPNTPPSSWVISTSTRPVSGSSTIFTSAIRHANSSKPTAATMRPSFAAHGCRPTKSSRPRWPTAPRTCGLTVPRTFRPANRHRPVLCLVDVE